MPITNLTQDEVAGPGDELLTRYTGTVELPDLGFTAVVTVDGGPDWDLRMIEAARAEAGRARNVAQADI